MKIYTLDFEKIIKVYSPYIDSVKSLEVEKAEHIKKMDGYKSEMQAIINSAQTMILDEKTKKERMDTFGRTQNEATKVDSEFRTYLTKMQDEILRKIYSEINKIVSDYSEQNSIDMVINNSEIVYFSSKMDITSNILDIIKENGLYTEEMINQ